MFKTWTAINTTTVPLPGYGYPAGVGVGGLGGVLHQLTQSLQSLGRRCSDYPMPTGGLVSSFVGYSRPNQTQTSGSPALYQLALVESCDLGADQVGVVDTCLERGCRDLLTEMLVSFTVVAFPATTKGDQTRPIPLQCLRQSAWKVDSRAEGWDIHQCEQTPDCQDSAPESADVSEEPIDLGDIEAVPETPVVPVDLPQSVRVPAQTTRTLTVQQMAEELKRITRPVEEESVPLKHKPDYNQAF